METIHIVLAEDHALLRQLMITALRDYNIVALKEAENGFQLLQLLQDCDAGIVLMDIRMPVMDGGEALVRIKKEYPEKKVIMLTTYNDELLVESFLLHGASAFLSKNTDIDHIATTIRQVHEGCYRSKIFSARNLSAKIRFSRREVEVIPLICNGLSNKEIADRLSVSCKAIEAHKKSLYTKTSTRSVAEFVSYVLRKGLSYLPAMH